MTSPRPTSRRRRLLATALPLLLVAGVLPLLAPTCGNLSPGLKTFARNSLIIPMDLCYQYQSDEVAANYGAYQAVGCPQGTTGDRGDTLKAYGLVYQLIRANIAVYWVINPAKAALADVDMSVQYNGGPPVLKYAWATGTISSTAPTAGSRIDYRGGPFVIDGSDYDRAVQILNANRATFAAVNVHVSNVAFQGNVSKVMAGGWSAGGAVPPKLALLDIPSNGIAGGAQNAESVLQGYLTLSGLDTASAGGTATGTHGQIYDRLTLEDFLPQSGGGVTSARLFTNGYQILWVPHWAAPGSCSDVANCSRSQYTDAQVTQTLNAIGTFVAGGHDLFAECAGIGSFEGVNRDVSGQSQPAGFGNGVASTRFFTPAASFGFDINAWPVNSRGGNAPVDTTVPLGNFSSPLVQLGDYPFYAQSGALDDFKPTSGTYLPNTVRFTSAGTNPTYDVFTMIPPVSGGHGTIVYLAGHSYSGEGIAGLSEVAGSRLVLNTLFNLGAACVESGVACNTGLLGECAAGVMTCDSTGSPVCSPVHSPTAEVCDGKDNDCDGLVDDGLDVACYDGPADSLDPTTHQPRGICQPGVRSCVETSPGVWGMSACNGQVLPAATETCNGLDNDCDGRVGNVKGTATALAQACYTGPSNTIDPGSGFPRGICKAGQSTCSNGAWSACAVCPETTPPPWRNPSTPATCQILPHVQVCDESSPDAGYDMTCTGVINCTCTAGTASCYDGPTGTEGVGLCHHGTRTCSSGAWGACVGQVLPHARDCASGQDNDCNGTNDSSEPACQVTACPPATSELRICRVPGITRVPATPTGTPQGVCRDGLRACNPDGSVGECAGMILPSPEICDGKDNNCDGAVDENPDALCNAGFTCVHGVCVKSSCGVENPCPVGYNCNSSSKCERGLCGGTTCADGQVCQFGTCADPCTGVECATGAVCSSGFCTGGGCYLSGCDAGLSCIQGQCQPDPCANVACPLGTFCRAGDCVQSCVYVTCPSGQVCSADGFCEVDRCAGVFCDPGQLCVDGACKPDDCATQSCGPRQLCQDSVCQDNPCNTVTCPVGACSNGQCYPVTQRDTSEPTTSGSSSTGCGCGSGDAGPLGALLLLLLLPLARRGRRPFRPGGGARAALLTLAALAALGGAACKGGDKSDTDYSSCTETCGEQRCIDLNYDSAHCGHCGTVCGSGQICRDGVCGPSSAVAPYVRAVSPDRANHGLLTTVEVTLTGDRFQDGATVRAVSGSGSRTFPATLTDATHLRADIDVSTVPVSQIALRVVNPDRVISNGIPFDVISVAPELTRVTPSSVTTGSVTTLQVSGRGFATTSLCHMSGGTMGEVVLATTPITVDGAPALACVFDATPASVQPGSYQLWVVNDNLTESNHLTFTVTSSVATLGALSPSSAEVSSVVDIDVTGSGFDSNSRVFFQWGSGTPVQAPTVPLDATHLLVQGYLLPASPGTATVTVRNGSTPSTNSLPFTAVPRGGSVQVTSLTVAPTPLYQGQNATLTFAGSGFPSLSRITVTAPTGATINATGLSGTASSASGTVALSTLSPEPAGTYSAYVAFSDGTVSSSFQFQVLSNVAVLQSVTPAGAKQGTNPAVITFKIGNVHGTPAITLAGGGTSIAGTSVTQPGADPTVWQASFDLRNRNTGTYTMTVTNPGAQPSNQISFTILPGVPAITTVNPPCAVQSNTVATVTITGQNFALPDAHGNALTRVMYSSDNSTFFAIPATVTVNSATQITVLMDTRNAVANTTYYVQVWNPDDPTSGAHQRSSSSTFRVAASSCP